MGARSPRAYPVCVFMGAAARAAIDGHSAAAYRRAGTEWGGLLWGRVFTHPRGGSVPVIVAATAGACRATPVSTEILPASWPAAERELAALGLTGLESLGDWHSHPKMGAFLSQHADVPAFWTHSHISPHWLSVVADPWRRDYGVFAKTGPQTLGRLPTLLCSRRIMQALGLPDPPADRVPSPEILAGGVRNGPRP